jgi:hypothetical protein
MTVERTPPAQILRLQISASRTILPILVFLSLKVMPLVVIELKFVDMCMVDNVETKDDIVIIIEDEREKT